RAQGGHTRECDRAVHLFSLPPVQKLSGFLYVSAARQIHPSEPGERSGQSVDLRSANRLQRSAPPLLLRRRHLPPWLFVPTLGQFNKVPRKECGCFLSYRVPEERQRAKSRLWCYRRPVLVRPGSRSLGLVLSLSCGATLLSLMCTLPSRAESPTPQ